MKFCVIGIQILNKYWKWQVGGKKEVAALMEQYQSVAVETV